MSYRFLGGGLMVMIMLAALPAAARLGETVAQCDARYGRGQSWNHGLPPGVVRMHYHGTGQVGITATFLNGRCLAIAYRLDSGRDFTAEEKQAIKAFYATLWLEEEKWEDDPLLADLRRSSKWGMTEDRKIYFFEGGWAVYELSFCTSAWLAHEQRVKRAEELRKAQKEDHALDGL